MISRMFRELRRPLMSLMSFCIVSSLEVIRQCLLREEIKTYNTYRIKNEEHGTKLAFGKPVK